MKTIHTLVADMNEVIKTRGGWDAAITDFATGEMRDLFKHRLETDTVARPGTLRMSNMGSPCERKLWYEVNEPNEGETLGASTLLKFLYGDVIEVLLLSLAKASGHDVRGMQDELSILDIIGHRDAVIDGITVDVKSASPYSFDKFKAGVLRDTGKDPFGYISQLSSYVYAGHRADPDGVDECLGAFLVADKVSGEVCLDMYNMSDEIKGKEADFERKKIMAAAKTPPPRGFEEEDDGYWNAKKREFVTNGNKTLGLNCGYCARKAKCWPKLRTFVGAGKPKFLTKVVKLPRMHEVK